MPDTQLKGELETEEFIAEATNDYKDLWNKEPQAETLGEYLDRRLDERRELRGTYRV